MFPGKLPPNLQIVTELPHEIEDHPHVWIPLSDGVRLAARIWRPVTAVQTPVPAILEYIPYRKTDGRRADDEQIHPYFAGHGYACARVDIRGCGDSEGLLQDEYLRLEQEDALEVIAWLAAQPWCDGNVGMMGLSWGGFNSLQVAARAPEALKAIIAVGATVDRYNDDVHYKQGCLLNEHFGWGSSFTSFQTRPPDPAVVGEVWREMWLERLENLPFFAEKWFEHPLRDEQWTHGSVKESYETIKAATMIVSGWGDLYVNAVPEILNNLSAPSAAIVGAWAHQFPHLATPGPAIDFLGEGLRWWDHWLKGMTSNIVKSVAYAQASSRPNPYAVEVPGRWLTESVWPSPKQKSKRHYFSQVGLSPSDHDRSKGIIHSPVDVGSASGELIPHCLGPEMPVDQRGDDAGSLTFDSAPLTEAVEIWGEATVQVTFVSDRPSGNLIVRLCDVAADGTSERVALGMLNLTLRKGLTRPEPLPIGEPVTVTIKLDHIAHRFETGQQIRVALSTHYWPLVWPAPDHPTLQLAGEASFVELPVHCNGETIEMAPPVAPVACEMREIRPPQNKRQIIQDQAEMSSAVEILDDYGAIEYLANGMMNSGIKRERYTIGWDDPLSATAVLHWTQELGRGAWQVRTETHASLRCDRHYFYLETAVEAYEGEKLVWSRRSEVRRKRIE